MDDAVVYSGAAKRNIKHPDVFNICKKMRDIFYNKQQPPPPPTTVATATTMTIIHPRTGSTIPFLRLGVRMIPKLASRVVFDMR